MGTINNFADRVSLQAADGVEVKAGYFVELDGDNAKHVVTLANTFGLAETGAASSGVTDFSASQIGSGGKHKAVANGAITKNDEISVNVATSGDNVPGRVKSAAAGELVVGRALEAATTAGQIIDITLSSKPANHA